MRRIGGVSSDVKGAEHTLLYLTIFIAAALVSASLLLFALVLYVAELVGSLVLSTIIIGVALMLIATVVYIAALRPILRAIRDQLQTIYDVSLIVQIGYNWVISKIESFVRGL